MYFKLYQIDEQCQKYAMIGLVPFFAQYYLEEGDEGFERYQKEHYVEVSLIDGKYEGKVDERGMPLDQEDYKKWIASFPTEWRWTPFVTQQILFETSHVADKENILFCFDWGLSLQHQNYITGGVVPICEFSIAKKYEPRIADYKMKLKEKEKTINLAYQKSKDCMAVDYTALPTATKYRVR